MVSSEKHLANVVGGKTARACDNCIRKRARWYCAADDAFLCQSCDGLVHAANPLARRHERLRLNVASLKLSDLDKPTPPPWHQGFTKKPRTPRGGTRHKHASHTTKSEESSMSRCFNPLHLVPEIGSDETTTMTCDEHDEQLVYQVPVFYPFSGSGNSDDQAVRPLNGLILPSDVELAEFAADVESLLGKGLDDESFDMEGLGFLDCREIVKVEEDIERVEMMRSEPFDQLSFDYDSPLWEEKDEKVVMMVKEDEDDDDHVDINNIINIRKHDVENNNNNNNNMKRILKLDFEGIIAAWDEERSPWTTGDRPELDQDDCWPECTGGCGIMHHYHHLHHSYGDMGMMTGNSTMLDGGREARVSRYREKRRTRLFSKKIRYEVRKLNAEKRPRMKGRFVKRTCSSGL